MMYSRVFFLLVAGLFLTNCSCTKKPNDPVVGPVNAVDMVPAYSPDGQWIAFYRGAATIQKPAGLWMVKSDGSDYALILAHPQSGRVTSIDWSGNGNNLVVANGTEIYKVSAVPGATKEVLHSGPLSYDAHWSPNSEVIVYAAGTDQHGPQLNLMDADGQNKRLLDPADSIYSGEQRNPEWSSNDDVMHVRYDNQHSNAYIASIDTNNKDVVEVYVDATSNTRSSNPRRVGSDVIYVQNPQNLTSHPQIIRVGNLNRCLTCGDELNEGALYIDYSPITGKIVYTNTRTGNLWIMNADGSAKQSLTDGVAAVSAGNDFTYSGSTEAAIILNDPLFGQQHAFRTNLSQHPNGLNIGALSAWARPGGQGNRSVGVGLVDEGIQFGHEDLSFSRLNGDPPLTMDHSHGMAMAGIIGATANNDTGIVGVDWNCKIYSVRNGTDDIDVAGTSIATAWNNGGDIINCSFHVDSNGSAGTKETFRKRLIQIWKLGGVVFAAEPQGGQDYLVSKKTVFGVGPYDINGNTYINYGNVDFRAPGGGPGMLDWIWTLGMNDTYALAGGSSPATAYASGCASLLLAYCDSLGIWLDPEDQYEIFARTAIDRGARGFDGDWGWGAINIGRAMAYVGSPHIIRHYASGGNVISQTGYEQVRFNDCIGDGGENIPAGVMFAKRFTLSHRFDWTGTFINQPDVWARSSKSSGTMLGDGVTLVDGHTKVYIDSASITPTGATFYTYTYELVDGLGRHFCWFPQQTANVVMAITVVGEKVLTAPGLDANEPDTAQLVSMDWDDPNPNEVMVKVERKLATANWNQIDSLPENTVAYDDGSMMGSAVYDYRVAAATSSQEARSNEVRVTTPPSPPRSFVVTGGRDGISLAPSMISRKTYPDLADVESIRNVIGPEAAKNRPDSTQRRSPSNSVTLAWEPPVNQNPANPITTIVLYAGHYINGSNFQKEWFSFAPTSTGVKMCLMGRRLYTFRLYAKAANGDSSLYATYPNTQIITGPEICPRSSPEDAAYKAVVVNTETGETTPGEVLPTEFVLTARNYPNPFNGSTLIQFSLTQPEDVNIEIFNILGQSVRLLTLPNSPVGENSVVWDGRNQQGGEVGSGVYMYRVSAGTRSVFSKMVMLK